jgi:hypothetical protein
MTTTIEKQQTEMPGMPQTALGRYAGDYCEVKEQIVERKAKLTKIGTDIVGVMRKESKRIFTFSHDGVRYRFEVTDEKSKLKCTKAAGKKEG